MSINDWMKEVRILDGGVGSQCLKRSKVNVKQNKAWSCSLLKYDPNTVRKVHQSYIRAGSDVISTNTYQASPSTLASALDITEHEAIDLMHLAVNLVWEAIDLEKEQTQKSIRLSILIAGSLGPYGACKADGSEYTGSYASEISYKDLVEFHFQRAKVLLEAKVDFIAWETIPLLTEVLAICDAMRKLSPALCWISVASNDGEKTVGGDSLRDVSNAIANCDQVFGVGVNCNIPHHLIGKALTNLMFASRKDSLKKIPIFYANDGMVFSSKTEGFYPPNNGPKHWLANISPFVRKKDDQSDDGLGQWVGGCCRVGPKLIAQLAQWMKSNDL